jgi:diguanylate cyclase (GGDEF)-like protein
VYHEVKTPIYDPNQSLLPVTLLGISTDITEQKYLEDQVRHLANTDPLTGLTNRRQLLDRINQAQLRSKRSGSYGALLYIDLDRFKAVNDLFGHEMGDRLLIEVANSIRMTVRESDTVARIGGDEFIVLVENISTNKTQASGFALQLSQKISAGVEAAGKHIDLEPTTSASIGIALFLGDERSASDILSCADVEMYKVKRLSKA